MPRMVMFLFAWFAFISVVSGASGNFIDPPERSGNTADARNNLIWNIDSDMVITWTSSVAYVTLAIWQTPTDNVSDIIGTIQYLPGSEGITSDSYTWRISIDGRGGSTPPMFDLTQGNIFFLTLYVPGETAPFASSEFFNLTAAVQTTTSSSSSVVPTSSTTVLAASTTVLTASTTSTNTPTSTPSSTAAAISSSEKLGIGLGVGIGIPLLVILAGAYFLLRTRRNSDGTPGYEAPAMKMQSNQDYVPVATSPNPPSAAYELD